MAIDSKSKISPNLFYFIAVLALSVIAATVIYRIAWSQSEYKADVSSLQKQSEIVNQELSALSSNIISKNTKDHVCKTHIAIMAYELRKDAINNSHRFTTLYANLSHTNALFITILVMIITGLMFSLFQMATAYQTDKGISSEIVIEAMNIKVRTGYVSIAVSVISILALSFYLIHAHEVKELTSEMQIIDFDFSPIIVNCPIVN